MIARRWFTRSSYQQRLPTPFSELGPAAGINPADLAPDTALLVTQVLLDAADRMKALALAAVADVERRQLYLLDDAPSTGTWVVEQATSFGRGEVALARKLDRVPQVASR